MGARWSVWWVCDCRSKGAPGTNNSLTSSGMLFRVSSFVLNTCNVLFVSETKEAVIPMCSPRSKSAVTLVASRPEVAFIDLIGSSISGVTIQPIAVKFAFWILFSTVSERLIISLLILSMQHLFKVFTFTVFLLVIKFLSEIPTVNSWSPVPSLTIEFSCLSVVVLPKKYLDCSHLVG